MEELIRSVKSMETVNKNVSDLGAALLSMKSTEAIGLLLDMLKNYGVLIPLFNVIDVHIDTKKKTIILYTKYREIHIAYNGSEIREVSIYGKLLEKMQHIKTIRLGR